MKQSNVIQYDEKEIDIKMLFAYVLKQWRKVLTVMIVLCVLMLTYKSYKMKKATIVETRNDTVSVEDQKTAIEKELESTKDSIKVLNDYIKNSVYANIDPYNEVETSTDIAIVTSAGTTELETLLKDANRSNQIVQAYSTFILKNIDYDQIANKLNLTSDNVKEIVTAKPSYDTDTITLTVIGSDSNQTNQIIKYIIDKVDNEEERLKSQYGDHSIVTSEIATNTKVDDKLLSTQTNTNTTASYSNNVAMTQAVTRLNSLKTNLTSEQTTLKSIGSTSSTNSSISPSSFIKYGFAGLFSGLLLMTLFYGIKFSLERKISSEEDIKNIYGIKILSVLPMNVTNKKLSKLDVLSYRQIDSSYGICKDIAIEKAMMNISGYAGDKKLVLLIGSGVKENLEELQVKLQELNKDVKFSISNNINEDSSELAKLKDTDGVIIVAERNSTRIDDLTKSIETIYNWKKEIIGSIVL